MGAVPLSQKIDPLSYRAIEYINKSMYNKAINEYIAFNLPYTLLYKFFGTLGTEVCKLLELLEKI